MCLNYAAVGKCDRLQDDTITAVLEQTFLFDHPLVRNAAQFDVVLARRSELVSNAHRLCAVLDDALARYHDALKRLKKLTQPNWLHAVRDIDRHLQSLVYDGFVAATPWLWLGHYPRYLAAIGKRLDKLAQDPNRDRQNASEAQALWEKYLQRQRRHTELGIEDPELTRFRWLIEELRVSLFAQELKTIEPVSVKRLEAAWRNVRAD